MKSKTFLASILQNLQNVEANFFTQFCSIHEKDTYMRLALL
jgi:hypothetical protein